MIKHRFLVAIFASLALSGWSQQTVIVESFNDGQNSDGFSQVEGSWHESVAKSAAEGLTATRSRYNDADTEAATARFTPNLPSAGKYEVFITYPPSGNASDIIYRINTADGMQNLRLTQYGRELSHRPAADQWHSLGVYNFEAGQAGYVEVSDPLTGESPQPSEPNSRIYADAVKFVKSADSANVTPLQAGEGAVGTAEEPAADLDVAATREVDASTSPGMAPISGEEVAALPSLPGAATPAAGEGLPALPGSTPEAGAELPSLPGAPGAVPAAPVAPGLPSLPEETPAQAAVGLPALPAESAPGQAPAVPGLPEATAPDAAAVLPALPGAESTPAAAQAGQQLPGLPSSDAAAGELPPLPGTPGPVTMPDLPSLAPVTPTPSHALPSVAETPARAAMPGLEPSRTLSTIPTPVTAGMTLPTPIPGATLASTPAAAAAATGEEPFSITTHNPSQLEWMYDFGAAQAAARNQGKKVLVFFTAEHNRVAQSYETEMFNDPGVRQGLSQYVLMKADFSKNTRLAYSLGVFGAGVIAVVNDAGEVTSRVVQKPANGAELITQLQSEKAVRATPPPNPQFTPEVAVQPFPAIPGDATAMPGGVTPTPGAAAAASGGFSALSGQALPPAADATLPGTPGTPGLTDPAGMASQPATLPTGTPAALGPAGAPAPPTLPDAAPSGPAVDALPDLPGM